MKGSGRLGLVAAALLPPLAVEAFNITAVNSTEVPAASPAQKLLQGWLAANRNSRPFFGTEDWMPSVEQTGRYEQVGAAPHLCCPTSYRQPRPLRPHGTTRRPHPATSPLAG